MVLMVGIIMSVPSYYPHMYPYVLSCRHLSQHDLAELFIQAACPFGNSTVGSFNYYDDMNTLIHEYCIYDSIYGGDDDDDDSISTKKMI